MKEGPSSRQSGADLKPPQAAVISEIADRLCDAAWSSAMGPKRLLARFITNRKLVGSCTGRSQGFGPGSGRLGTYQSYRGVNASLPTATSNRLRAIYPVCPSMWL